MDTSVYIDPSALESWGNSLKTINDDCISVLDDISSVVNSLDSCFKGNVATSFEDSIEAFLKQAKSDHENMSDLNAFLQTVINTMNNE